MINRYHQNYLEKHFSAAWEWCVLSAVQYKDMLSDLGSALTLHCVAWPFGAVDMIEDVPHYHSAGLRGLHVCVCACVFVVVSVVVLEVVFSKKSSIKAYWINIKAILKTLQEIAVSHWESFALENKSICLFFKSSAIMGFSNIHFRKPKQNNRNKKTHPWMYAIAHSSMVMK